MEHPAHRKEERNVTVLTFLIAILIAAHSPYQSTWAEVVGSYAYWLFRLAIEALLFFAVRAALENRLTPQLGPVWTTGLAILISHLPFVLSVTALDIVLGFPELDFLPGETGGQAQVIASLKEAFFLADNHLAFCLLLTAPRWFAAQTTEPIKTDEAAKAEMSAATLLSTLEPPLNGTLLWIEAQEHYVRLVTTLQNRTVLARFSDVIRELGNDEGLQVHRSHWVAKVAIEEQVRDGQKLHLRLISGDIVPVSRSFKHQVQRALED